MPPSKKILFVCLGNTCRSPMAECYMTRLAKLNGLDWECDSAALRSWNVGYYPERRCLSVLHEYGLDSDHLGRELHEGDYHTFDHIFGMDEENMEEIRNRAPSPRKAKLELLGSYLGPEENCNISDPFYDKGLENFRRCFDLIAASCMNFLNKQLNREEAKAKKKHIL